MKNLHWIIYSLAQFLLMFTVIWIGINSKLNESDVYFAGFLIASYGFLLILSSDVKSRYNAKSNRDIVEFLTASIKKLNIELEEDVGKLRYHEIAAECAAYSDTLRFIKNG